MIIPRFPPEPARLIAGWAIQWNEPTLIQGQPRSPFFESIERGAFSEAIAGGRVELWFDHERKRGRIAGQDDGSLVLAEDDRGLWFEATIAHTDEGDEALRLACGAGYRACSVGMRNVQSTWRLEGKTAVRTIHKAGLREISICSRGAYPSARIGAGAHRVAALRSELV
jgi:hypothetical protein